MFEEYIDILYKKLADLTFTKMTCLTLLVFDVFSVVISVAMAYVLGIVIAAICHVLLPSYMLCLVRQVVDAVSYVMHHYYSNIQFNENILEYTLKPPSRH